jgi:hypothetical protein
MSLPLLVYLVSVAGIGLAAAYAALSELPMGPSQKKKGGKTKGGREKKKKASPSKAKA